MPDMTENTTPEATPFRLVPNPHYGAGVFRRRVRLQNEPQRVVAEIEDDNHGFRIFLEHDGKVITGIVSDPQRVPMSTCSGAGQVMQALVGVALSDSPRALASHTNPRAHCTHQFDLLGFAVTHALRSDAVRQYDVSITDERDGLMQAIAKVNDAVVFDWQLQHGVIQNTGAHHGVSLHKGFSAWAEENLHGAELEVALVMQRAHFVCITRRFIMDEMAGMRLTDDMMTRGVCYAYTSPVLEESIRLGNAVRDFTDTPERLLLFK